MSQATPDPEPLDPELTPGAASGAARQRGHKPAPNANPPTPGNERQSSRPAVGTGLDQAQRDERQSPRTRGQDSRTARHGLGGSNRLLTVADVADWLGVPTKTIYARWREWGLRAYKIGRHLRFRERHLHEWLEAQEKPWQ